MNLISETLDQMFMLTDHKALLCKDYKQVCWFSKGGFSEVFELPHQNFSEFSCALEIWFRKLTQYKYSSS